MGKKKIKWRKRFDSGSLKVKSGFHIPRKNPQILKQTQITNFKASVQTQGLDFSSSFYSLAKSGDFNNLYRLVNSRRSSRFIGSLDQNVKVCITHYRRGLDNKDITNNGLPLILRWYLKDCYSVCAYVPKSTHIYPINGFDERKNAMFVTHDITDAPLLLHPSSVKYTLKDLMKLYERFNFITLFNPNEIIYSKVASI